MAVLVGTEGKDNLAGQSGTGDTIIGRDGDDLLIAHAGSGADYLEGDGGNDHLVGNGGNDILTGGADDDILSGGAGADLLMGGSGSDLADYSAQAGVLQQGIIVDLAAGEGAGGDAQGDLLFGIENILGTSGADVLIGDDGANAIHVGSDFFHAVDVVDAGGGDDTVTIGTAAAIVDGGAGEDRLIVTLAGTTGSTFTFASGTTETGASFTHFEHVTITGTQATDTLYGGAGLDVLMGGAGRDYLRGGEGNDALLGGDGHDSLRGGGGDDRLEGGWGNDYLVGGTGADTFVFDALNSSRDRILDFQAGADGDKIELSLARQGAAEIHSFDDFIGHLTETDAGLYLDLSGAAPWPVGVLFENMHISDFTADNLVLVDHLA
ncbi:calcium-binding protein [Azorhizobium sp. AG788]|uniref:calcium-binding protein n=1 Tax=Azorhizobium sp. AG788 TaxID=2183897 RepID=UPI0031395BBA